MANKGASVFDLLSGITDKKKKWESWSETDRKVFAPFLINRWLSMNTDLLELVNFLQRYTIGVLKPRETYKLYHDVLPQDRQYVKYIKGKNTDKYEPELVDMFAKYYGTSKREATDNLDLLFRVNPSEVETIVRKFGKTDKEVKKLLKVKK